MRKILSLLTVLLLALAFTATVTGSQTTTRYTITIANAVQVGGTMLQPGDYTVKFDGGQKMVSFWQGDKQLASSAAEEITVERKFDHTEIIGDGPLLKELDFGGTRVKILLKK